MKISCPETQCCQSRTLWQRESNQRKWFLWDINCRSFCLLLRLIKKFKSRKKGNLHLEQMIPLIRVFTLTKDPINFSLLLNVCLTLVYFLCFVQLLETISPETRFPDSNKNLVSSVSVQLSDIRVQCFTSPRGTSTTRLRLHRICVTSLTEALQALARFQTDSSGY